MPTIPPRFHANLTDDMEWPFYYEVNCLNELIYWLSRVNAKLEDSQGTSGDENTLTLTPGFNPESRGEGGVER